MTNERGTATFEVLVLVMTLTLAGFIGLRVLEARNQSAKGSSASSLAASPAKSVDNTAAALAAGADNEAKIGNLSSSEASDVTASSSSASELEGSYDENSF